MSSRLISIQSSLRPTEFDAGVRIAEAVRQTGGRAFFVGGCVRDALLGRASKDADMEVFGLEEKLLLRLLRRDFEVNAVGRAFGVFKLRGLELDVSLPRRESKQGTGHRGFAVTGDPHMSQVEAASRRDFTLNALSWDPLSGELVDPFNGRADLENRILRHTSDKFSEDPLRVLRAMQFLARFELTIAPETLELCRQITPENLPRERIFSEWEKLVLKGVRPSLGLTFLKDCGWIRYTPELAALVGCEQDPQWHPEGDVWTHTLHCMDAFARQRIGNDWEDLVVGLAVLCHDMGKPQTTYTDEDGRIRSPRHDTEGVIPAELFLRHLTAHQQLIEDVLILVETHMRPALLHAAQAGDNAVRRLARKVGRIDRLIRVAEADMGGRPPLSADFPAGQWLLERAEALSIKDAAPEPLIQGRHLIAFGLKPGPRFRPLIDACYEAQLDGEFNDLNGGLAHLKALLPREPDSPATSG
ncbi:polynucleotide adenylyltransferase [Ruficoccus amylovorans]|uniref:Polynucleotide adenylyltransferase n=1 Tax=Ruficoccus amylovorans TaxID=1804625 RepID=A0A842HEB3_9BACT|nr:polynucleotide adenylyltransferase [Ruficoccus amylovorans]MBC2593917.1 polynucleotide adenylyltransferase [Ruficoccus amylovorans]